jgi:hypothetical protein
LILIRIWEAQKHDPDPQHCKQLLIILGQTKLPTLKLTSVKICMGFFVFSAGIPSVQTNMDQSSVKCPVCQRLFKQRRYMERHLRLLHGTKGAAAAPGNTADQGPCVTELPSNGVMSSQWDNVVTFVWPPVHQGTELAISSKILSLSGVFFNNHSW